MSCPCLACNIEICSFRCKAKPPTKCCIVMATAYITPPTQSDIPHASFKTGYCPFQTLVTNNNIKITVLWNVMQCSPE